MVRRRSRAAPSRASAVRKGAAMTTRRRKVDALAEARLQVNAAAAELKALQDEELRRDAQIRQFVRDEGVGGVEGIAVKLLATGYGAFRERQKAAVMIAAARCVRVVQAGAGRRLRLSAWEFAVIERAHAFGVPVWECNPAGEPWSTSVPLCPPSYHRRTSGGGTVHSALVEWCAANCRGLYHLSRPKWRHDPAGTSAGWEYCSILTCEYQHEVALARLWFL